MSTRASIEAYARSGQKIAAIKDYRELTAASLLDSKLAVEHFIAHGTWSAEALAALGGRPTAAVIASAAPTVELATVADLVRRGQKIAAIKALREQTGWGLARAKEAVEAFADRGQWPAELTASAMPASAMPASTPARAIEGLGAVEAFARAGRKIDAIKELRRVRGLGLKDAKEAVEAFIAAGSWPAAARGEAVGSTSPPPASPAPAAPPPAAPIQSAPPPRRPPLDPEAAEALAALAQQRGPGAVDQIHAVEKDLVRGYLAIRGERAYFIARRLRGWEVEGEYARSEGVQAELRTSLSRIELRLRKVFLHESITGLDEATARAIARLLDERAKV